MISRVWNAIYSIVMAVCLCTEEGTHCERCGRSHVLIAETRGLMNGLVEFVQNQSYDNPDDFAHLSVDHGYNNVRN